MPRSYDAIVLGLGGMGSAAAAALARRGWRVLGLEQFDLVHDRGSSHGHTRVIRKAYFEHPDYVPLLHRAYVGWHDLEQRVGRHLFTSCGCLCIGAADGELVAGVRRAAREHGLAIEDLTAEELRRRFPPFAFGDEYVGVHEPDAGFLHVEECVRACQDDARRHGADLRAREPALTWEATDKGVAVRTARGEYAADRLVLAAGPWAGRLLGECGAPLTVMRQASLWFGTRDDRLFRRDLFPIYLADLPQGVFYGLPVIDARGHKAARHYGAPELSGPDGIDRTMTDADEGPVRQFLRAHLPAADGPLRDGSVCIYTLTPDRHFVIDLHPQHPNVAVAAGFSGHGFKFAVVVGEVLADLAENGRTDAPISMFRFERLLPEKGTAAGFDAGGRDARNERSLDRVDRSSAAPPAQGQR